MMNIFKKESIKAVIVTSVICLSVAFLVGGMNSVTSAVIENREAEKIKESFSAVLENGEFNAKADPLREDAPQTVKSVYTEKTGKGYVVLLVTTKGYTGREIGLTVSVSPEGKIIKAVITKNEESIVPQNMKPLGTYAQAYSGATADTVIDVDTGATVKYSEAAIKNALYDSFVYLGFAESKNEKNVSKSDFDIYSVKLCNEYYALKDLAKGTKYE